MILESEREVQREFNAIYNHLIELKYALDQKKDTRSNRILGMIRKMEELIYETEVEWIFTAHDPFHSMIEKFWKTFALYPWSL